MSLPIELRFEVEDIYAAYAACIDEGELERWPEFFAEPCLYRIVSKENFERALPLSQVLCDSLGMLRDRALSWRELNVYAPRSWRHTITQFAIREDGALLRVGANFVVFESPAGGSTDILVAGRYRDVLVRGDGTLKFREKVCIYDTTLIPGSIVMPL